MAETDVYEVQRLYPQIFVACYTDHVLDAERVRAMLGKLKPGERREALRGLGLLAQAARRLKD
jgi:hypothetical protein